MLIESLTRGKYEIEMLSTTGFGVWESQESLPRTHAFWSEGWLLLGVGLAHPPGRVSQAWPAVKLGIAAGGPSSHRLTGHELSVPACRSKK